jgi:hypothetical protein
MLYARYVHLTRPSLFFGEDYIRIVTERVQLKKILVVILKGLCTKTNCLAVNHQP